MNIKLKRKISYVTKKKMGRTPGVIEDRVLRLSPPYDPDTLKALEMAADVGHPAGAAAFASLVNAVAEDVRAILREEGQPVELDGHLRVTIGDEIPYHRRVSSPEEHARVMDEALAKASGEPIPIEARSHPLVEYDAEKVTIEACPHPLLADGGGDASAATRAATALDRGARWLGAMIRNDAAFDAIIKAARGRFGLAVDDPLLADLRAVSAGVNSATWNAFEFGRLAGGATMQHRLERPAVAGGARLAGAAEGGRAPRQKDPKELKEKREREKRWAEAYVKIISGPGKISQTEAIRRVSKREGVSYGTIHAALRTEGVITPEPRLPASSRDRRKSSAEA